MSGKIRNRQRKVKETSHILNGSGITNAETIVKTILLFVLTIPRATGQRWLSAVEGNKPTNLSVIKIGQVICLIS